MCTRAILENRGTFVEDQRLFLTSRNNDWNEKLNTNLWAFPAGIQRHSMPENGFTWQSKYKTLSACITFNNPKIDGFHQGSANDGINEKGLVVNGLWLSEAKYGQPQANEKVMSIGVWIQYMLDNYSDVEEAIKDWVQQKYRIVAFEMPSSGISENLHKVAKAHISLSDIKGNSAIFEYYTENSNEETKLHITTNIKDISGSNHATVHYEQDCSVMTNSPIYSQQLKLSYYWQWQWSKDHDLLTSNANESAKTHTLPGTNRAPDRFARVSFYLNNMKSATTYNEWVGQAFSLMRVASVPIGFIPNPDEPNISNTLWTTVSDHANRRYYFQSTDFPNLLWVDLNKLTLEKSDTILELPVNDAAVDNREYMGNMTETMSTEKQPIEYFQFLLE